MTAWHNDPERMQAARRAHFSELARRAGRARRRARLNADLAALDAIDARESEGGAA